MFRLRDEGVRAEDEDSEEEGEGADGEKLDRKSVV